MYSRQYLPTIILAILADVVCTNSIIQIFDIQKHFSPLLLIVVMLLLQMLAAPIQAGFSDFYCRKKSLVIALSFSFLSFLFLCLFWTLSSSLLSATFVWLGLLVNAGLGNIVPIAWSAIADSQRINLRFFLALTTSAYAIGYMFLAILGQTETLDASTSSWLWQMIIMPLALLFLSALLVRRFYYDVRDKHSTKFDQSTKPGLFSLAGSEFTSLAKEINRPATRYGLLAYFCWATSQYGPLFWLIEAQVYAFTIIFMMCGYLTGVAILGFCKQVKDEILIRSAFVITIASLFLFFVASPFMTTGHLILAFCYFFYTLGNAFLSPSIFSLFSKERKIHEQGKGFGLIVSADSAGFLVAVMSVKILNFLHLGLWHMVMVSFIIFVVSWPAYSAYEKARKALYQ